jgi:pyrroline-5-carboxylate reductase
MPKTRSPVLSNKLGTIGFLGAGNMAAALIRGLLQGGTARPVDILASDVSDERLRELATRHGIQPIASNSELVRRSSILVLAVKPQVVDKVLASVGGEIAKKTLVVSIAAGVPISALEARLPPGTRVVRSMPNVAVNALAGATAIAAGTHAGTKEMQSAKILFDAVGKTVTLDESLLDAVTGLSGSGPAYVMVFIEALADGGVKVGLDRGTALLLAAQTVFGSSKLLLETPGEHPARLKDMVTSPGGTTIAGLHALESGALRKTLIDAVESATKRATELGAQMAARLGEERKAR